MCMPHLMVHHFFLSTFSKLFMLVFRLNIDDLKKEEMKMTHAKETKNVWMRCTYSKFNAQC